MADVRTVLQRLPLEQKQRQVLEAKASEYVRISTARLGSGGLGQGELCKAAACVELAFMSLGVALDTHGPLIGRHSGVGEKVYRNAKVALQKILGVTHKATARDLCIQFGCARHEASVRAALAAYKERFVHSLPAAQQRQCDFGRPVFLAAAFYLVARRNKVAVDRTKLLGPLGATTAEFAQVLASMSDLCHDLVGCEPRKRKAEEVPEEQRGLIDRTGGAATAEVAGSSDDEVEDEGQVGYRIDPRKQRQREYDEWKEKMMAEKKAPAAAGKSKGGGGGAKKERLTEKKLRQAVLSFGAGTGAAAQAACGSAGEAAGSPGQAAAGRKRVEASGKEDGVSKPSGGAKNKGNSAATPKAPLASHNT